MHPTVYALTLFVHIFAAVILVGTSLLIPLIRSSLQSATTAREVAQWVTFTRRTTQANPIAAIILLASGVYLGSAGWWTSGWFAVSVFAWLLNGTLAGAIIKPMFVALEEAAGAEDGNVSAELDQMRHAPRLEVAEEVLLGSDLAILLVMVLKPSLVASAAVLVAAVLLTVGAGTFVRRRRETQRTVLAGAAGH